MEIIRQAIERARSLTPPAAGDSVKVEYFDRSAPSTAQNERRAEEIELNCALLQSRRIISYDGKDERSRPYDILRTQVLQRMESHGWKTLGITSPTPRCGKTLTAINLAFSMSRQRNQSVILVDMDLKRPQVAGNLGLRPIHEGVLSVLEERVDLRDVAIPVRGGNQQMTVVPTLATRESAELMGGRAMNNLLQNLKRNYQIIIFDLPPILSSDDVIALLPQIDCILLTAAVGLTKTSEIEECVKHLQQSEVVRVVLNKATDSASSHYYY